MVSSKTKAVVIAGAGGAGAVTQLVAVKQLVDNTSSVKPLGNFSTPYAKGLNEWSTLASLIGGALATGYVIYQMEKGESLSDISIAIGTYGITSLTGGLVNAFLDPLQSNFGIDLSALLKKVPSEVESAFSKFGKDLSELEPVSRSKLFENDTGYSKFGKDISPPNPIDSGFFGRTVG